MGGGRRSGAWARRAGRALACVWAASWLWVPSAALSARVLAVSPLGEVPEAPQVTVRFDTAVVPVGQPRGPAPFRLECDGRPMPGDGHWADERRWQFEPNPPPGPGASCVLRAVPGWQPLAAAGALEGPLEYRFTTAGPAVLAVQPWPGEPIEEDQHFLLHLNGAADAASVGRHAWCEVEGLGERVALRVVEGAARERLLRQQGVGRRRGDDPARWLLLACERRFGAEARVRLVWGPGIHATGRPAVVTRSPRTFEWRVRPRFTAEFSCERERASSPCMPLRPMVLRFSAPVPREQALAARLTPAAGGAPLAPRVEPGERSATLTELRFAAPLPENTRFTLALPAGLRDETGRELGQAAGFPLAVATGPLPPLAKFPAGAAFGIVESGPEALLPLTLRQVQPDIAGASTTGAVRIRRIDAGVADAELLRWIARLENHHERQVSAREAGLPEAQWFVTETVDEGTGRPREVRRPRLVHSREVSLLAGDRQARRAELPQPTAGAAPSATEVLGIPLPQPGYHVVEVESRVLGHALLASRAPMVVRTGALVTNLGVHFKKGRSASLVWVTTLDRARPVGGARVAVNDCHGQLLWSGTTDAAGIAAIPRGFDDEGQGCPTPHGLFVTARHTGAGGSTDLAFVFSRWNRGIEPWRFNHPTASGTLADRRAHTVFDRTLLRAGEVLSMKHFLRDETARGLGWPGAQTLPDAVVLTHVGSGEEVRLPLAWAGGARSAHSRWEIPATARQGLYDVALARGSDRRWPAGSVRVEAFRVPLVDARLVAPGSTPVAPQALDFAARLQLMAGGPLARAPLRLSALLRERMPTFPGFDDFSFAAPSAGEGPAAQSADEAATEATETGGTIVADRLPATTDAQGQAQWRVQGLPALRGPAELQAELSFTDPNGERQTVQQRVALWPAAVVVGVRARSWAASRGAVRFDAVVLDTAGRPLRGRAVEVRGRLQQVVTARQRVVGGFYAYENRRETRELGVLCEARTDARGRVACEAAVDAVGEVELVARARDDAGRAAQAAASVWVTGDGEQWFAQDDDDRIDLLPEKRELQPGETARLQVRMPFREATALVTVEREGVLDSRLVTLRGREPVVELPVPGPAADGSGASWSPDVYVSVLLVRGRLRDAPWHSFFSWGWRDPADWWRAFRYEGRDWRAPTAAVDLARPSFRLGVARLRVGLAAHRLDVQVLPAKSEYRARETVRTRVRVTHGGVPAAGAEIAFAAVDDGLLALAPNASWDLLEGLFQPRPWGVETATAQGEIIGRRHYGRKTVPAGGGGGRAPTRELFDTLLLWRGSVTLDARGEAVVDVPLNDSLTRWRLVAIADAGVDRFGTGSAVVRVTQDLQLFSGLPTAVREGDRLDAEFTLRNGTRGALQATVTLAGRARAGGREVVLAPPPQTVALPADGAAPLRWPVELPAGATQVIWEASAQAGALRDRLAISQAVEPAVPVRAWQATVARLDTPLAVPVAPPPGALAAGGVAVALQPRLAGDLPGVRRWLEAYPYTCLEQKASRAIGLGDAAAWARVVAETPAHLDRDGLAGFFPARPEDGPRGDERLTAYLLAAAHEAGLPWPEATREAMLQGLAAFVEGRALREPAGSMPGLDMDLRRLAALEALARHGRAQPRMLGTLSVAPARWPTAALLDWWALLRRVEGIPGRAAHLEDVQRLLRARLVAQGGSALALGADPVEGGFTLEGPDGDAARLLLAAAGEPAWKDEVPRLVAGLLARQRNGAWPTTAANVWGVLATARFSERFETRAVSGRSTVALGPAVQAWDWAASAPTAGPAAAPRLLPWPAAAATLQARHEGAGAPWLHLQALAAVPLAQPVQAGFRVTRRVTAVERARPDAWSRGDVVRVRLEIEATADQRWVVVADPLPPGAVALGAGLAREGTLATRGERRSGEGWLAFEERTPLAWRAYYEWLPRGAHVVEYTLRLNASGLFVLPPTRVEAMYAPGRYGESPQGPWEIRP